MHKIEYDFEELQLPAYGLGATFNGMAVLIECDDWFRIKDIKLGWKDREGKWRDGTWLSSPPYDGGGTFEQRLFKELAAVLQKDIDVQKAWTKSMDELRYDRSEPDVYSALAAE